MVHNRGNCLCLILHRRSVGINTSSAPVAQHIWCCNVSSPAFSLSEGHHQGHLQSARQVIFATLSEQWKYCFSTRPSSYLIPTVALISTTLPTVTFLFMSFIYWGGNFHLAQDRWHEEQAQVQIYVKRRSHRCNEDLKASYCCSSHIIDFPLLFPPLFTFSRVNSNSL